MDLNRYEHNVLKELLTEVMFNLSYRVSCDCEYGLYYTLFELLFRSTHGSNMSVVKIQSNYALSL
jgi:hypothetical protein